MAGLTVALFTIPQAMAYALIAGFPPSTGIATAIAASILGAIFGSSQFLINGPTNALAAMLASNVALLASHGDPKQLVILLTLMIGVGQCLASLLKAGSFTRFVSEPVLAGFTAGAGIYIVVNQLPAAFGLEKKQIASTIGGWEPPKDVLFDFIRTLISLAKINYVAILVVIGTILMVRGFQWLEPKTKQRIPATFLTVILISFLAYLFHLGDKGAAHKIKLVKDIEPITRSLPTLVFPQLDTKSMLGMIGPALAIGLLGAVEAIAIAKSLAARVGHKFDANKQLVGEGACNIAAALVGGFAASGSFTRTAVNFEAGAVTKMSAILSGLLVLSMVLLFGPLANYIPLAVLAGLLIHIGFRLVNLPKVKLIMKTTVADRRVVIATFIAVMLFPDLAYALFFGVGVSVFQAIRRAEGFKLALLVENDHGQLVEEPLVASSSVGPIVTLDLQGELFFAAAEELEHKLKAVLESGPRYIVLRLQQSYNMDLTCAEALAFVSDEARRRGGRLILSGLRPGMYGTLERACVVEKVGDDALFAHEPTLLGSTHKAIDFAQSLLSAESKESSLVAGTVV